MNENDIIELLIKASKMTRSRFDELLGILRSDDAAMNRIMKEQWDRRPRKTIEDVIEYYRESDVWMVNEWNHGRTSMLALAKGSAESLSPGQWFGPFTEGLPEGSQILDYGGGLFNDSACLVFAGYKVDQAEIYGPVTEFLKMFKAGLSGPLADRLGVVDVDSEFPICKQYDGVACFEVLEHLPRPMELTKHLYDRLAPGGPFAYSASFGGPEYAPYHMAHNAPLGNTGVWTSFMESVGFKFKYACTDCHKAIWRKP